MCILHSFLFAPLAFVLSESLKTRLTSYLVLKTAHLTFCYHVPPQKHSNKLYVYEYCSFCYRPAHSCVLFFVVDIHSCLVVFDLHTSIYSLAQPWLVCFLPLCSVHRARDYHSVSGEMVANGCHQMTCILYSVQSETVFALLIHPIDSLLHGLDK